MGQIYVAVRKAGRATQVRNSEQRYRGLMLLKDPGLARNKSPNGSIIMGVPATFHVGRDLNAKSTRFVKLWYARQGLLHDSFSKHIFST